MASVSSASEKKTACIRQHTSAYVSIRREERDASVALLRHLLHLQAVRRRMSHVQLVLSTVGGAKRRYMPDSNLLRQYLYFCAKLASVFVLLVLVKQAHAVRDYWLEGPPGILRAGDVFVMLQQVQLVLLVWTNARAQRHRRRRCCGGLRRRLVSIRTFVLVKQVN